jgi:hypothetical protein
MKMSNNGKKLGMAIFEGTNAGSFNLFDFDPTTGNVSNPLVLANLSSAYGCEFSPDGSVFYGSRLSSDQVLQWNLCAGSASAIIASQFTVGNSQSNVGSLQLAVDGKIYVARISSQLLAVIGNPNSVGPSCNYVDNGPSLLTNSSFFGLPNIMSTLLKPSVTALTSTISCNSSTFAMSSFSNLGCASTTNSISNFLWNFGDPNTGTANSSTLANPTHFYNNTGNYYGKLILNYACGVDTFSIPVTIEVPTISLSGNFSICIGQIATLTASGSPSYTWNGIIHSSTIALTPTISSTYSISASNSLNTCVIQESFVIQVSKCTDVERSYSRNDLIVFPNPFSGRFSVVLDYPSVIQLRNLYGEIVLDGFFDVGYHEFTFDGNSNIYLLTIISSEENVRIKLLRTPK